ncbi:MAG: putative SOS response-associated peptidase YedK [Firmicutes bacterium ADurb.Bin456]|nr:MAG: putative SOS response-associated peptidase YedK [Firmicutes bacterium ADurb.Bin456]
MCGRFTLTADIKMLKNVFQLKENCFDYIPRYNIAPGQNLHVIIEVEGARKLRSMKWGLIPAWARDAKTGFRMINARSETIDTKPAFKGPFQRRRCLIPADGFYEWTDQNDTRKPFRIILPGGPVFAFAGIWERWKPPQAEGTVVYTCSVITAPASEYLKKIHDRMPVILDREQDYKAWLGPGEPAAQKKLLQTYRGDLEFYPVTTSVNSPQNDHPGLIQRDGV